jgi:lysophospholipase L1-like esterase
MNWETYIALGDSITIGARTYIGYPELVGDKLSRHLRKQWNVVNHSFSGFKAIDLARSIDLNYTTLMAHKASITSILIGSNDVKESTSEHEFKIAMNQIILKSKLLTTNKNVVVIAIPTFQEGIMYPYSIDMNNTVRQFNGVIEQLAHVNNIRMVEIKYGEIDFLDGVHLNINGTQNFSEQICRYILKDKGIHIG